MKKDKFTYYCLLTILTFDGNTRSDVMVQAVGNKEKVQKAWDKFLADVPNSHTVEYLSDGVFKVSWNVGDSGNTVAGSLIVSMQVVGEQALVVGLGDTLP